MKKKPIAKGKRTTGEKTCSKCGLPKRLDEFHAETRRRDGRRAECKECANARKRQDKENNRKRMRKYRAANPEINKRICRAYYQRNSEKLVAKNLTSRKANPEKTRKQRHESYIRNRPKILIKGRKRYERIKFVEREKRDHARARKHNVAVIEFVDRAAIITRDNSTCYLCGQKLEPDEITFDHVIPFELGGNHTAENLKVACRPCNSAKCNKSLEEYLEHRNAKEKKAAKRACV